MTRDEVLRELYDGIRELDEERLNRAAQEAVDIKLSFDDALSLGLAKGIRAVGDRFESGELFLPHLVMAGDLMDKAVKTLSSRLPHGEGKGESSPRFVIGTVEGDIHEIGKNIVALMLRVGGFKVVDIGVDVPIDAFVRAAEENQANIVGASALLTTTQFEQKRLVEQMEHARIRSKYKVMVGGGQVTAEWAREIGADGYGKDAMDAVQTARNLTQIRETGGSVDEPEG